MSKAELKKISVEVSKECWKKLKILSIQQEITLGEQVRSMLERAVSKKNILEPEVSQKYYGELADCRPLTH